MPIALIVDDEPEANRLLARLVQLRGFRPVSAFTGEEARAAVAAQPPDILFLDLMLPDASGFEICRVKGRRDTAGIPIVMNTARLATENRLQSYRNGANLFIPKPYFPEQIFAALQLVPAWQDQATQQPEARTIPLDNRDEPAAYAAIASLWGMILHRTAWPEGDVARLVDDLNRCVQEILAWGRAHRPGPLGTLAYDLRPDHLRISFLDEAGWIAGFAPGPMLARPGGGAEILTPPGQHETVLHVRFEG